MAQPREVPGLDCEEPFGRAAARVVKVRAEEVFEHSRNVLDTTEIERVHDMRVATRRLRATLELFEPCFPRKRYRRARRKVKALAGALGERRDRDVQIEFLEGFIEEADPPDGDQVARLVVRLRLEQEEANEGLAPFVAEEKLAKLRRRLEKLVASGAKSRGATEEGKAGGLDPGGSLRHNAARVVGDRLARLRALEGDALEPDATEAQHELRIAAKRLRYALEVVGFCFAKEAGVARKKARELQSVLGDLHDCDLMLPEAEGIDSLTTLLRTRRELLYARFRDLWCSEETKAALAALERRL